MSTAPLDWAGFRFRLERTRSPRWIPAVVPPATGPQLYLPERERLASAEKGSPTIEIEIVNLGTERAMLKAQVLDAAGKQVGKSLSVSPASLPPQAREICRIHPTSGQQELLLAGGSLLLHPGSLPEAYRTLHIRAHPLLPPATLDWSIPVPHFLRFSVGKNQPRLGLGVKIENLQRETLAEAALDVNPGGGEVALLLPCVPMRYRFITGHKVFRDPENPLWLSPPDDTWSLYSPTREWTLANTSSFRLRGALEIFPAGRIRVDPEFVDLAPGERRPLKFSLDPTWPEVSPRKAESITVSFRAKEAFAERSKPLPFLRLGLHPELPDGPAVRLLRDLPEVHPARRGSHGRWEVVLPIENLGTEPASLILQLGSGDPPVSSRVEIPPSPSSGRRSAEEGVTFELPDLLTGRMDTDRLLAARIVSERPVIWDARLRGRSFKIGFTGEGNDRITPEPLSMPGDLFWEVKDSVAKLMFKNKPMKMTVQQVTIFRNKYPQPTLYLSRDVSSEVSIELASVSIRLRWWLRFIRLRAEASISNGSSPWPRTAEIIVCWRARDGPQIEYLPPG